MERAGHSLIAALHAVKACVHGRAHDRKQMLDEFRRQIAVKVQVVLDSGKAIINVHLAAKEKLQGATDATGDNSDIPMNDETAGAATKIQARFRRGRSTERAFSNLSVEGGSAISMNLTAVCAGRGKQHKKWRPCEEEMKERTAKGKSRTLPMATLIFP